MKTTANAPSTSVVRIQGRLITVDCTEYRESRPQKPCAASKIAWLQPEIGAENGFGVLFDDDLFDRLARRNHRQHVLGEGDDDIEDVRLLRLQHPLHRRAQFALS